MGELVKEGSLGEVLFRSGIISEDELDAALKEQKRSGCRIGKALVKIGAVTQEDIDWALSHQLDIPYVRLKRDNLDPNALARVPGELARRFRAVPIVLCGDELSIALEDPLNREALDELERATGCRLNVAVGLEREIREMLDLCYGASDLGFTSPLFSPGALEAVNADPTGEKLLNHLLLSAVKRRYSQISLHPLGDRVRAVAREKGGVSEVGELPAEGYRPLLERVRALAQLEPDPLSAIGILWFLWQGKNVPFQVLLLREELLTLRLHLPAAPLKEIADLGLSCPKERDLKELVALSDGMVLVAAREHGVRSAFIDLFLDVWDDGGKTALLLGEGLGRGTRRHPKVSLTGSGGGDSGEVISAALEHDPDLLAVEELRDPHAFAAAGRGALRGKTVLAGVASGSMAGLLERLLELRREGYLAPGRLKGAVALASVLLLCPDCKEEYRPEPEELAALKLVTPPLRYFRPTGCPSCSHTGHVGRGYLLELIRFDEKSWTLFKSAHSGSELLSRLKEKGYRGIAEEGGELLERGEISPAEYLSAVVLGGL